VTLPLCFCWTRYGTEAGQTIDQIFKRKEQERAANGGIFFWGIGNAIGPSVRELLRRTANPEVLFSPIKSAPRLADARPESVVAWTSAETLRGDSFDLPFHSLVTSRYDPNAPRESSYALVCFSTQSLNETRCDEQIAFAGLRNLRTGRPVGASQVTAIVQSVETAAARNPRYEVSIRARLVEPYFLRLRNPLALSSKDQTTDWEGTVREVWSRRLSDFTRRSAIATGRLFSDV
jgi:hypothetical protein